MFDCCPLSFVLLLYYVHLLPVLAAVCSVQLSSCADVASFVVDNCCSVEVTVRSDRITGSACSDRSVAVAVDNISLVNLSHLW